ncbi:DNA polymerase delta, subunit 4 [Mycotypha africana]|uniref:DNA polymerase delta, subunit 4 n=1 Tax=Mycotypha africana TaxID=64632 RepID=UPI002300A459|nr:DNA polymerase delta, subunit 4 [Mycotypha africana]KAI8990874.1 DNA polymerase delta, subunit 4 [Mycotypha africana]
MPAKKSQKQGTIDLSRTRRSATKEGTKNKKPLLDDNVIQIGEKDRETLLPKNNGTPIHQEHLTETNKLLRAFDLDYTYGPCIGISRLERWERAEKLNLNPPPIIKDILTNDTSGKYKHSLFHEYRDMM